MKVLSVKNRPRFAIFKILKTEIGGFKGVGLEKIITFARDVRVVGEGQLEGIEHQVIITDNDTNTNGRK